MNVIPVLAIDGVLHATHVFPPMPQTMTNGLFALAAPVRRFHLISGMRQRLREQSARALDTSLLEKWRLTANTPIAEASLHRNRCAPRIVGKSQLARDTCMIAVGVVRNGVNNRSHHLRKNHYCSEGEKEVASKWIAQGAAALGPTGSVKNELFNALRQNNNPVTSKTGTARDGANRGAFLTFNFQRRKT